MDWIRRGLRFECQPDCGLCCTQATREGSVFLEAEDIERLARHLKLTPRTFVREFTVNESGELELSMSGDGSCRFLDGVRCSVHAARPLQCRSYPFLPLDGFTPIESAHTWRYEKKFCPGIGKGRLYRKREILEIARGRVDVDGFDV